MRRNGPRCCRDATAGAGPGEDRERPPEVSGIVGRPGRAVQSARPAASNPQGIGTVRNARASPPDRGRSPGRRPGSASQAEGETHVSQGHHPGRRLGDAALSHHPRGEQAAPAGLRQADDLLPAVDADARRHPRGAPDLDARRHRRVRAAAGGRPPVRDRDHLCRPAAPGRAGPGLPHRCGVRRRRPRGPDPRRQHLLRPGVPGDAPARPRPGGRGHGVRLPGQGPPSLRRRRVRPARARALDRGEAGRGPGRTTR